MTIIHRALLKIRPEPLAAVLKKLLGVTRREVETSFGRFYIDPASNFGACILSNVGYEPDQTAQILRLTRGAKTFVDVGANEGYFAVIAARNMRGGGAVLAIEPQERLLPVLMKNMELNSLSFGITICAVSDHDGMEDMFFSTTINTGTSGFVRSTRYPRPKKKVRVARLEHVLEEAGLTFVDCMKMDIEGLEYEAILGSPRLFEDKMIKTILVETHIQQLAQRGRDPKRIFDFLRGCGYKNDGSIWSIS